MTGTIVAVEGLAKRYGSVVAVADASFEVRRGEIFGILGRNGAGERHLAAPSNFILPLVVPPRRPAAARP